MLDDTRGSPRDQAPVIVVKMPQRTGLQYRKRPSFPHEATRFAAIGRSISVAVGRGTVSRFEQMARAGAKVSIPRQEVLGLLLATTLPLASGGRALLRPIWANEAMHRAYGMVQLIARLEQCAPLRTCDLLAISAEHRIARELADTFRALDVGDDNTFLACSRPLRSLARGIVELFGCIAGLDRLDSWIEPVLLPAYRRRALLLAAHALVSDVLCNQTIDCGCISVTLRHRHRARASLRIAVDGRWASLDACVQPYGVVADLASLLESEPVIRREAAGRSSVEIAFPVQLPGRSDGFRQNKTIREDNVKDRAQPALI